MLYNKNWDIKVDPFSLDNLIAWLEKQPANEPYEYGRCRSCLLAIYFKECGFEEVIMGSKAFYLKEGKYYNELPLPPGFNAIAHGRVEYMIPNRTFGAALERAYSFRKQQEK